MGIGSITSTNRMSVTQISSTDLKDQKSKTIQNEITDVQQQMRKLSSDEELSATEKAAEQKKLQKEKSNLSTELKLHQEELLKSKKRELKLAKLQEDADPSKETEKEDDAQRKDIDPAAADQAKLSDQTKMPADDRRSLPPGTVITRNSDGTVILKEVLNQTADNDAKAQNKQAEVVKEEAAAEREKKAENADTATGTALSERDVQAMVSADSSMKQADRQGTLVTRTTDDIAVLKGEIKQDAYRGTDTEGKRAELKDMQQQRTREMAFQFSLLGEADNAMQASSETNDPAEKAAQANAERTFHVSGLNTPPEEQALQQGFQVSIA